MYLHMRVADEPLCWPDANWSTCVPKYMDIHLFTRRSGMRVALAGLLDWLTD